jgi:two-component system sensor histidine kinase PhoQ
LKLSILHRLLLVALLVLGLFALVIPLSQIAIFASTLEEREQRRLAADARTILAAIQTIDGQLQIPDALENPSFNQVESDLIAAVFDVSGAVLWRSSSALDFLPDYMPSYHTGEIVFTRMKADDSGRDYFIYDWDVEIDGLTYSIVTGDLTRTYDRSLAVLKRQTTLWLGIAFAFLLALLAAGLIWALQPLRRMYLQLLAVERGEQERLAGEYPRELARLATGLNSLLASEKLRREHYETKVSDLAHGLKTPLVVITQASRSLPQPDRQLIEDHVQHMNQLVSYHLQRAMPTRPAWVVIPLQLEPVLEKLCSSLDKVYHEKYVAWDVDTDAAAPLITEAEALEVFGNLLDNAFRLCHGRVRVRAVQQDDFDVIQVEDDGPGVPQVLRNSILERGSRADTLHAGQGIGLALVVEMLEEIHGTLEIRDSRLGGACFELHLPRLPPKAARLSLFGR